MNIATAGGREYKAKIDLGNAYDEIAYCNRCSIVEYIISAGQHFQVIYLCGLQIQSFSI